MPRFGKQTIAQTFKFDCDRFLRFQLCSNAEKESLGIEGFAIGNVRPGVQLMQEAGNKWEIDKYNDLIFGLKKEKVSFVKDKIIDPSLGVEKFHVVKNLLSLLNLEIPPRAIIEAEFKIPDTVSKELEIACKKFGIEPSSAIPDIILIKKFNNQSPLIQNDSDETPEFELHIIDVKLASEASLKHFTEVTFYALALDAFIREHNLASRYRVSAKGLVWPGSHDANEFRNLLRKFEADGKDDPTQEALQQTLIEVPYEVYEIHVKRFFKERLLPILQKKPEDASWHISSKCQLCQYLTYCQAEAERTDHLSRLPWLNGTQANLLRIHGINTTKNLAENVSVNSEIWNEIKSINYQLRADELGIKARCNALCNLNVNLITERKTYLMPNWVDCSIFLTLHFDPGSGITFAIGAKKVYFRSGRLKGEPPQIAEKVFIIDKVEQYSPDTERNRLLELIDLLESWLVEVNNDNEEIGRQNRSNGERDSTFGKMTAHIFFWSKIEVRQLLRMIERHMHHPEVIDKVEVITRLFPPDSMLPVDIEIYKSQPGTIVKDVIKHLVALPIPYDYTLIETANKFFPKQKEDGSAWQLFNVYGFWTPLNDQIPFERAYELWKDNVFLKHSLTSGSLRYTRDEIYEGLKRSVKTYLQALQNVVMRLRENCGTQLALKKPPFFLAPLTQIQLPQNSRNLILFTKLSSISREIENLHKIALPVIEKEAKFISMRGLIDCTERYQEEIQKLKRDDVRLVDSVLYAFQYSINSRDAKFSEGDFLCCLTNEDFPYELHSYWYTALDKKYYAAVEILNEHGINPDRKIKTKIYDMLSVTIIKIEAVAMVPFLILKIPKYNLDMFNLAIAMGIIDLKSPMVIDSIYKDFESNDIEKVLRKIGGKAPKAKRKI